MSHHVIIMFPIAEQISGVSGNYNTLLSNTVNLDRAGYYIYHSINILSPSPLYTVPVKANFR